MKLIQKTSKIFLIFATILLSLVAACIYLLLSHELSEEQDEYLINTRHQLSKNFQKIKTVDNNTLNIFDDIDIKENKSNIKTNTFQDTSITVFDFEDGVNKLESFRQYKYTELIQGQSYIITLRRPQLDNEDIQSNIMVLVISFLALSFLLINLFHGYISKRIWAPFYKTLDQITSFDVSNYQKIENSKTDIDEFVSLEKSLSKMTQKLVNQYSTLKQFTENASHEIQTPLAIIQSQIELLQQKDLNESDLEQLINIQTATSKLSKINKALLLLTKIENNQFSKKSEIELDQFLIEKLGELEILINAKSIQPSIEMTTCSLLVNPLLLDSIIGNLLNNAIKYAPERGIINIKLTQHQLSISNKGEPFSGKPEDLFLRFQRANQSSTSLGLGLSIAHQICLLYDWDLNYTIEDSNHRIQVSF